MRFPIDHFQKKLCHVLFSSFGRVETEVEVAVDTQRIDMRFHPTHRSRSPPPELGLLGRIAASAVLIESYHRPPSLDELRDCVRKLLAAHHVEVLRVMRLRKAWRRRKREKGTARGELPAWPEIPVLWITSAGRPRGAIEAFAFQPFEGWPAGVYVGPQAAIPVRLVLVNELPEVRETLWLRLMGRGATRFRAVDELAALPADAWERRHIAPLLIELQRKLAKAQGERMLTQAELKQLERDRKAFEALETRGIKKGLAQGREQGLALLVRQVTRKLGRPVTDRERATLVRRLDSLGPDRLGDVVLDLDAPALAAWLANPRAR